MRRVDKVLCKNNLKYKTVIFMLIPSVVSNSCLVSELFIIIIILVAAALRCTL
jgi:hypothetical protein